jgi:DHA1 family tetracycline resistance protein-like MFS transporter
LIIPKIGESRAVVLGLFVAIIGMTGIAFAWEGWVLFAATVPLALGGINGPSLQSIASKEMPANEQGELQGILTSVMSVTAILGPWIFPWLFSAFSVGYNGIVMPGAPYLFAAVLQFAALIYAVFLLRKRTTVA